MTDDVAISAIGANLYQMREEITRLVWFRSRLSLDDATSRFEQREYRSLDWELWDTKRDTWAARVVVTWEGEKVSMRSEMNPEWKL